LNHHKISTGRTVCRPFRENSKTTVPRKRHVSSTRRFRGRAYVAPSFSREETRMSHAISHPGASAGARAAVRGARGPSERADSAAPALARGVPSVCWGVLESARFARFQPEFQIAPRPLVWRCPAARCGGTRSFRARCELSSLRRRRRRLWSHHSGRGRRLRAAGRRPRASISLENTCLHEGFLEWQNDVEWRVGTRRLTHIRAHRSIWGPNRFNSRIPV